jgi:hypothetical protein
MVEGLVCLPVSFAPGLIDFGVLVDTSRPNSIIFGAFRN